MINQRPAQEQGLFSFIREFAKQMIFPCVMYFYVVPALFGPEQQIQISNEEASWTSFIIKLILGFLALFICMIILLYF